MHLHAGDRFAGYRILRALGSGTRGSTWLAHDERLGRAIALRLLTSLVGDTTHAGQRFVIETGHLARLAHPCLLPIHAVGSSEGVPWMAMDYADGGDLRTGLESEPLPLREGIEMLGRIAAALDHVHALGVVHRDLTPANLFRHRGESFLLLAQPRDADISGLELGNVHRMAPELVKQFPPSVASDLYALGVIAFRWLSGRFPFDADDALSIALAHVADAPPLDRLAHLPEAATGAIARALAKEPAARFGSAVEFIHALRTGLNVDSA